ncbi:transcriptional activator HAP2 [Kwoniella shandongensis]|uniref:Transcriptional activator HAP2 n=1 Tax=Kwoniella shandongensis TaxID=1734106 RepID=A0A5M6CCV6_9TREE|nr:transcriptional activator HAP2 [Kwoniella shandongensis]KAA5531275.1 transcriptional activator HAP2 [Kwoniella shandongensis]
MSTTLPLFSLLPNSGSPYPPSPTFSDPSFPTSYDGGFASSIDLSKSPSNPLHNYSFPTPPATSSTGTSTYNNRHLTSYPNLIPPNFSHSSFPTTPDQDDPTSSYLDLDLSQPGPSTYHASARMYDQISHHTASGSGSAFDEVSLHGGVSGQGNEFVQQSDDEDDDDVERSRDGGDELVKMEGEDGSAIGGDGDGDVDNEEPLYVNAKQYHRILKRRTARARLEELNRLVRSRKPYLHESRHRHACSRPRGKGGRFLTADEIEALKKEEAEKAEMGGGVVEPVSA